MFVLGFTDEDVTGGWQHWRLATEFGAAFEAEDLPPSYGTLEAVGEGRYLVQWYLRPEAAAVLDRHGVDWRRFLIGRVEKPPAGAHPAVVASTQLERQVMEERKRAAHKT